MEGQGFYDAQCANCHGEDGSGNLVGGIDNTKATYAPSNNPDNVALSLADYIDVYMPTNPGNCTANNGCAESVAAYILNNFSVSTVAPVSEDERLERVSKGDEFYRDPTVNCVVCHGNDGRNSVGDGQSLENCNACTSWTALRDYIVEFMPPEPAAGSSETGPFICTIENACATYTTDWIWNVVNGWTLTADGGVKTITEDRFGQDTLRIKSYEMLSEDFTRIFGSVPANLAASATAFNAAPEYWYEEPEMGAVTLNILANSAVQSCENEDLPAINADDLAESCRDWARRMWLRDASEEEVASCVAVALEDTTDLNDNERAVFTCVSMMLSLPALTY